LTFCTTVMVWNRLALMSILLNKHFGKHGIAAFG